MGAGMMQGQQFQPQQYQYDNPYRFQGTPMFNGSRSSTPSVQKVHGEEGARQFPFGTPNGSVLLLDDTDPIVWLRVNNELGHPTVSGYSIAPLSQVTATTPSQGAHEVHDERIELIEMRLDEIERKMSGNGKSNSSGNGRSSGNGNS